MNAAMTSPSHPGRRPQFLTPLLSDALFDTGSRFPAPELTRRILSHFWRDCCLPSCFSRAPAPVIQLSADTAPEGGEPRRTGAWWLLLDGMIEDDLGPYSDRLRPFFGGAGRPALLWPRYEFTLRSTPTTDTQLDSELALELIVHAEPLVRRRQRIVLRHDDNHHLTVSHAEVLPSR